MKISYTWLQEHIEEKLPSPKDLAELIIMHAFEVEDMEQIGDDTVMDIKVLPDRAHDCLSHKGIVRELCGLLGLHGKVPEYQNTSFTDYPATSTILGVSNNTAVCRRYVGRIIRGVTVGESPEWLRARLEAVGQKSINNVVDLTNFILFDLGQPTHAFDLDKLASPHITIRQAQTGESITTLDGKEVTLDESVAVIADDSSPLAIAGVKGGTKAEVDVNTKNIVIEIANFDPVSVRKTARRLGILTDAAKRFENNLSTDTIDGAYHMLTDFIVKYAGGTPEDTVDTNPNIDTTRRVSFSADYISQKLGVTISVPEIKEILDRYHYVYSEENGEFRMIVPYPRLDITGAHDMVEEIGRAYGYDKVPPLLPETYFTASLAEPFAHILQAKAELIARGYRETMTYTFTKKGVFEVARGAKGKSALRANLLTGLQEAYEMNRLNAAVLGLDEIKIFEIGSVFPESGEEMHVAWIDAKGSHEESVSTFAASLSTDQGRSLIEESLVVDHRFFAWSEFPAIVRDVALWVPAGITANAVLDIMLENLPSLSIGAPRLFDTFTKDDQTSYAFRLVFQATDRTLTDAEVDADFAPMVESLKNQGWTIR